MAQDHRVQAQRFELKYLIDDAITPQIRDFARSYLELDDYGLGSPQCAYDVHTLYLDSDDLKTYQDAVNGTKNRFKLRLRYYDDKPETPVFFEIKARMDNCILKQRCPVRREAVPLLLAGQLPAPGQMLSREARHFATLQRFNMLLLQLNARPKTHNNYLREAWVSPHDNSLRVTMDRNIRIEPYFIADAPVKMTNPTRIFTDVVILELKFTTRFPAWFRDLVCAFNLMQFSASKYSEGILIMGEDKFHDGDEARDWQGWHPRSAPSRKAMGTPQADSGERQGPIF
jgi:hypothetical protein